MLPKDSRYRFLLENANVRGVLVYLDDTWREVLSRAEYPAGVQAILGQAMVAMPLLASTVKFDGRMTLQARGAGPVTLLVVQAVANGTQRGLAKWNADVPLSPLSAVLGEATLSIQIESGKSGDVYQGVVDAGGESLQQALASYFENSEQLSTRLWLFTDGPRAAGVLLQRLPQSSISEQNDDNWRRVAMMVDTLERSELMAVDPEQLLGKLFAEDHVRLFDAEPLSFACGCSRARTAALISGLGRAEAEEILAEQGSIEITCEFCNSQHGFDVVDVEGIFRDSDDSGSQVLH